jgi:hypothetical protein
MPSHGASPLPVVEYAPPARPALRAYLLPLRRWLSSWPFIAALGLAIGLCTEWGGELLTTRVGCYIQTFYFLVALTVGWKKRIEQPAWLRRSALIAGLVIVWLMSNILIGRSRTGTYYLFKPFGRIHVYNGWIAIPPAEMKSLLGFGSGVKTGYVVEDYE